MNLSFAGRRVAAHKFIHVRGARQHNLRNVDVDLPRDRLTVITGPSGSGKSSLAFDTIYAEGQRKYVESLSVHARQFLAQMAKPDVDRIEGLGPTLAIEQRTTAASPRSTVATSTEIYDFLRVLFARAGEPTCWVCGAPIARTNTSQIVDALVAAPPESRVLVLAPLVRGKRGTHAELLRQLTRQGFVRVRLDGKIHHVEDLPTLNKSKPHDIDVVVDRVTIRDDIRGRAADSIELALRLAEGRVILAFEKGGGAIGERPFSTHFGCPLHPEASLTELSPRLFSFNSPHGACAACYGLGTVLEFDPELIVADARLSLQNGALAIFGTGGRRTASLPPLLAEFCKNFKVSPEVPYRNLPAPLLSILLHGTKREDLATYGTEFIGLLPYLRQRWEKTDSESVKQRLHAFLSEAPCTVCGGGRLRPEALAVKVAGRNIAELCRMGVGEARRFFDAFSFGDERDSVAGPILREVRGRLRFMCNVGLDYLTLDRPSATLSGGEAQRIRLATQIGSGLVGVCYVLDEPTIGLHQRDSRRLVATLKRLVRLDNTVIVVEHDEEVIAAADHLVDIGPGAGSHGGQIMATGTLGDLMRNPNSITGRYLAGVARIDLPERRRQPDPQARITIQGATANNLKNIDVSFPLGCFVCVTGVSGSGKSTLVSDLLLRTLRRVLHGSGPKPGPYKRLSGARLIDRVVEIDQTPIGRSPRSNPSTYVGAFDLIRQLFAKTREAKLRGYSPARFSFNVRGGRCEDCQGQGTRRIEMHFLPDVFVRCATCRGTRYNRETLEVKYRGLSIADVLELRVEEAARLFANFPKLRQVLRALLDVGLGYITLGQSAMTLSGGEAQRVKLAAELGKTPGERTLYVLDEPTTGLHFADVANLVSILNRLVDLGHSLVVIEHNLEVIKMADSIIDLGPEGGDAGGYVVVAGTPEEVAACPESYTGRFLKSRLQGGPLVRPRRDRLAAGKP